ncbi:MAG: hypothetical protein WAN35_18930 [Terracidiphilus sp.]
MSCKICGVEGPTKDVTFYQNIGMLVTRQWAKVEGELCRPCIGRYFRSYSLTTLFLGWWGVISFVVTPFILINNVFQYLRASQLAEPGIGAMNVPYVSDPPSVGSGSFKFKVIYGMLIGLVGLGLLAYYNVGFMEKHAPAINAHLHGGEITDETDGEYAGSKIWNDIRTIEAEYKGKGWNEFRPELLSREPYLTDLKLQNDRLQRRMITERSQNMGANDVCEQLALDEMSPALDAYTKALSNLFVFTKSTAEMTKENSAEFDALSTKESNTLDQLNQFITDNKKHGCDK